MTGIKTRYELISFKPDFMETCVVVSILRSFPKEPIFCLILWTMLSAEVKSPSLQTEFFDSSDFLGRRPPIL